MKTQKKLFGVEQNVMFNPKEESLILNLLQLFLNEIEMLQVMKSSF